MAKTRHEELGLTNEDALQIFETMLMARRIFYRLVLRSVLQPLFGSAHGIWIFD